MNQYRKLMTGILFLLAVMLSPVNGPSQDMPDVVSLDSLARYYEGVVFSHARHVELGTGCAACHHHTTGTAVENANCARCHKNSGATATVSCRACHAAQRFSAETINNNRENAKAYHQDTLGLQGAYHQGCRGCHLQYGAPTGCVDCHARNKAGDDLYNPERGVRSGVTEN